MYIYMYSIKLNILYDILVGVFAAPPFGGWLPFFGIISVETSQYAKTLPVTEQKLMDNGLWSSRNCRNSSESTQNNLFINL